MRDMAADSIDAIVTDPPYGLSFMGKDWDHGVPGAHFWMEALRVAKPGAHLLAFGGTRTYHRLTCAIEDAGWEIRDCLGWLYGSGFPKSLDVSKAIDKARTDDPRPVCRFLRAAIDASDHTTATIAEHFGFNRRMVERWAARDTDSQPAVPTLEQWERLRSLLGFGDEFDIRVHRLNSRNGEPGDAYVNADVIGEYEGTTPGLAGERFGTRDNLMRAPATEAAQRWQGWGTALKPSWEPIILARKPLGGTVAANVLRHGTGALNIDGCRISTDSPRPALEHTERNGKVYGAGLEGSMSIGDTVQGRWPANILHDGSKEVLAVFPQTKAGIAVRHNSGGNTFGGDNPNPPMDDLGYLDSGSAARFFYCAKASKADRDEGLEGMEERPSQKMGNGLKSMVGHPSGNNGTTSTEDRVSRNFHPTVKPTDLMRYLCRLVTPPGGVVLDPFMGSGSTGKAAVLEGFAFTGIEKEPEYLEICRARIADAEKQYQDAHTQGDLFN